MSYLSDRPTAEFISAKTAVPIRYRHPATRTAMIQATLAPAIRSIDPIASGVDAALAGTVTVFRKDGRFALDLVPARLDGFDEDTYRAALARHGIERVTVTADDLKEEPRRSNCALAWGHRGLAVPLVLRRDVQRILAEAEALKLGVLCDRLRIHGDPFGSILALACSDLVEIDMTSGPIGPTTAVRVRS